MTADEIAKMFPHLTQAQLDMAVKAYAAAEPMSDFVKANVKQADMAKMLLANWSNTLMSTILAL